MVKPVGEFIRPSARPLHWAAAQETVGSILSRNRVMIWVKRFDGADLCL